MKRRGPGFQVRVLIETVYYIISKCKMFSSKKKTNNSLKWLLFILKNEI